jgi:hypothetical protein
MEIRWLAILLQLPLTPKRRKKRRLQQFPLRQSYVPERKKRRLGNAFPPVDLATCKASEGKGGNGKDVTETRRQLQHSC